MNIGEFKFILNSGQSIPSYNKGEDTSKLHFRVQENQVDEKFQISSPGMYKITLNIINLTIQIEILDMPEYAEFWFVGGFSSWNFEQMRNDVLDHTYFILILTLHLQTAMQLKNLRLQLHQISMLTLFIFALKLIIKEQAITCQL